MTNQNEKWHVGSRYALNFGGKEADRLSLLTVGRSIWLVYNKDGSEMMNRMLSTRNARTLAYALLSAAEEIES